MPGRQFCDGNELNRVACFWESIVHSYYAFLKREVPWDRHFVCDPFINKASRSQFIGNRLLRYYHHIVPRPHGIVPRFRMRFSLVVVDGHDQCHSGRSI